MRPEEIRAQISSLNDELKDTIKEVNAYHGERDLLLKEIEELKLNKTEAERLYKEEKDRLASIRYPQEQKIKGLEEKIAVKQVEVDDKENRISKLRTEKANLEDKIKNLKDDHKKLLTVHKELEEAEKSRPLIEAVKKELLETIDQMSEAKWELDRVNREAERIKNRSDEEQKEHRAWLVETKTKTKSEVEGSVQLRIAWETKLKDLKIVEKRLKKLWEQSSKLPFPKIYDARSESGN